MNKKVTIYSTSTCPYCIRAKEFLKEHIAIYKLPREIEYRNELPRTPTGKLLRRHLRPPK